MTYEYPPDEESEDWTLFGHFMSVTPFDQVPASRRVARANPILTIGAWPSFAEVAVFYGLAFYDVENKEDPVKVRERLMNTNIDRVVRGELMRRALEEWKDASGLNDALLQPNVTAGFESFWDKMVHGPCEDNLTLRQLQCSFTCGETASWNWTVNKRRDVALSLNGVRTGPNMWRNSLLLSADPLDPKTTPFTLYVQGDHFLNNRWAYTLEALGGRPGHVGDKLVHDVEIQPHCESIRNRHVVLGDVTWH